jgi:hypothetical protein
MFAPAYMGRKRFFKCFHSMHEDSPGVKPQISPLRCAPVEMTNLLSRSRPCQLDSGQFPQNKFVISTGAQRSGEICGFSLLPPHML